MESGRELAALVMRRAGARAIDRATRRRVRGWLLAAALLLASAAPPAGAARAETTDVELAARPADTAPDPRDDPRRRRTGQEEQALHEVGDAVFSRPVHVVRLIAGVAMLPVALPLAAVLGDWRDALDICVTGPFAMVFERPLDR
jgi:hypothetical protein